MNRLPRLSTVSWIEPSAVQGRTIATGRIVPYLGPAPFDEIAAGDPPTPQAFLVETNNEIAVHFHPVPQFQFFVSGEGAVARHSMRPGSVHYADPFTPYGPLRPVGDFVGYLTLRATADSGAEWMPERRAELSEGLRRCPSKRRNLTFDLLDPSTDCGWADVLRDDDGLAISLVELVANATVTVPWSTSGAFIVVLDGSVASRDEREDNIALGAGTFAWSPATARDEIHAGPNGAKVAWLQLPTSD